MPGPNLSTTVEDLIERPTRVASLIDVAAG